MKFLASFSSLAEYPALNRLAKKGLSFILWLAVAISVYLLLEMLAGAYFSGLDFGDVRQLVDLGAEWLMLLFLIGISAASLGVSWQTLLRSLACLLRLFLAQLYSRQAVPPTHILLPRQEFQQHTLHVKRAFAHLAQQMAAKRPLLAAGTRTPFLLFRQAPLRVAP